MTAHHSTPPTKEEFFEHLLLKRRPEAVDPKSRIAQLASVVGAEAIVRTIDVIDGFQTPEPTELQLSVFALHQVLTKETTFNTWVTIG